MDKIDNIQLQKLITIAIDGRRDKDFAAIAGFSPSSLSHLLNNKSSSPPSERTLRKIADASEGRVSLSELMFAVGKTERAKELQDAEIIAPLKIEDKTSLYEIMMQVKGYVDRLVNNGIKKYYSITEIQHIIEEKMRASVGTGKEIRVYAQREKTLSHILIVSRENGYNGSEYCIPITCEIMDLDAKRNAYLIFGLCVVKSTGTKETNSGIIVMDIAYDLMTMDAVGADDLNEMHKIVSERDGAKFTEFELCYYEISQTETN